jgi:hypothetical protein
MHGRKCFAFVAITTICFAALAGCSSNELMKPDCHSCTDDEQSWKEFSWNGLVGKWKGSVEDMKNSKVSTKKSKTDKVAELNFVNAGDFLQAWGGECKGLPNNALVLNGVLWEGGLGAKEYEAFVPVEDDRVAYGRVSVSKLNGQGVCRFRRLGRVMGKNRLNLPSVSFSDRAVDGTRRIASAGASEDISVEFLRFVTSDKPAQAFTTDGRKPSSVKDQERPSLILRVFRVSSNAGKDRGEWTGTQEYIYRLWKAN